MRKKGLLPLILGLLLLTVFASAAFAPEFFTSYSQKELFTKWLPMSREHLLGTNAMGYDILTELIYGARQTLLVGILSSILTLILGAGIGILGSFRGWIGQLFQRAHSDFCSAVKARYAHCSGDVFWKFRRAPDRPDCGVQLGRHGARRARKTGALRQRGQGCFVLLYYCAAGVAGVAYCISHPRCGARASHSGAGLCACAQPHLGHRPGVCGAGAFLGPAHDCAG